MRTKVIAALLVVLTALGGLNLFQSIKDRLFPPATAQVSETDYVSEGKVRVRIRNQDATREEVKVKVRETESSRVQIQTSEAASAHSSGDVVIDERFDVREGQTLVIGVTHSDVTIETGNVDQAHVLVSVSGRNMSRAMEVFDSMNFQVEKVQDEVRIESESPRNRKNNWSDGVEIYIHVTIPVRFNAQIKTTHGDVELDDLQGDIRLNTTHGDVLAGDISGPDIFLSSTHGSIRASALMSDVIELRTSHADIRIEEVKSENFSATTTHSDVEIGQLSGESEISTSHGDIEISLSAGADADLQTSHGDVTIYLASSVKADLDLKGARVKLDSSFDFNGSRGKERVTGQINGGGSTIQARTTHGEVVIRDR